MKTKSTAAKTKRPRQDKRRARNHDALLTAAIDVVIAEGPGALTPLRITEQAKLHKRAFYAHFKNVDECLQAVAVHIHELTLGRNLHVNAQAFQSAMTDHAAVRDAVEDALRTAVQYGRVYELFGRCRYDNSPLGKTLRNTMDETYAVWTQIYWDLALSYGIQAKHLFEIQTMAKHIIEHHMVAIGRLISGDEKDISAMAARVQRYNRAIVTSEFRRMLGLRSIAGDSELAATRPPPVTVALHTGAEHAKVPTRKRS